MTHLRNPTVAPTAAMQARIAREDARVMLAAELRAMMHPSRAAVVITTERLAEIITAPQEQHAPMTRQQRRYAARCAAKGRDV